MSAIELGGTIGGAIVGGSVPEILYAVTGVDLRDVLPLRALLTGVGGFAGHLVVSALGGIINSSQEGDGSESVTSDVWLSLRQPPEYNPDEKDR